MSQRVSWKNTNMEMIISEYKLKCIIKNTKNLQIKLGDVIKMFQIKNKTKKENMEEIDSQISPEKIIHN